MVIKEARIAGDDEDHAHISTELVRKHLTPMLIDKPDEQKEYKNQAIHVPVKVQFSYPDINRLTYVGLRSRIVKIRNGE